jgi:hypothetical protein
MDYIGCSYVLPADGTETAWGLKVDSPEVVATIFSLPDFQRRVTQAFRYVQRIRVWVAPLPEAAVKDLKDTEAMLIYDLRPRDNARGKAAPPKSQLAVVHHNAQWATDGVRAKFRPGFQLKPSG